MTSQTSAGFTILTPNGHSPSRVATRLRAIGQLSNRGSGCERMAVMGTDVRVYNFASTNGRMKLLKSRVRTLDH